LAVRESVTLAGRAERAAVWVMAGKAPPAPPLPVQVAVQVTGPRAPERGAVDPAIRRVLRGDPRFSNVEVRTYGWNQAYTAVGYRKLMLSYSSTQMMTPPARQGLLDDMENFVRQQFNDQVTRPIVVTLTTATVT
jgi:hypothetical protein